MRRLNMLGLSVLAGCALTAVVASAASAVVLPEFTVESKSTGTSETVKFNLTGASIICVIAFMNATPTSHMKSKGLIWLLGCLLKSEECHSLGDTAENILIGMEGTEAEFHLVRLSSGSSGIWVLKPPTHILCKSSSLLVKWQGNMLGAVTPILTKTTKFLVNVNVVAGKQEITEFENDAGEKVKAKLEGSINGGAAKGATMEMANLKASTELETEIIKTT
jgi:hypothetical protein